jgi:hypothetical protein
VSQIERTYDLREANLHSRNKRKEGRVSEQFDAMRIPTRQSGTVHQRTGKVIDKRSQSNDRVEAEIAPPTAEIVNMFAAGTQP